VKAIRAELRSSLPWVNGKRLPCDDCLTWHHGRQSLAFPNLPARFLRNMWGIGRVAAGRPAVAPARGGV